MQEPGLAVNVAVLGGPATVVYRRGVAGRPPPGTPDGVAEAAGDSLAGAHAVAGRLPAGVLDQAKEAAASGLNTAAAVAAVGILALPVGSAVVCGTSAASAVPSR